MAAIKSETFTSRINASVSKHELDKFKELCKLEGRTQRAQIMVMTNHRLSELKRESGNA